jgi:hypothetical protein
MPSNSPYPSIPVPTNTVVSMYNAMLTMRQTIQLLIVNAQTPSGPTLEAASQIFAKSSALESITGTVGPPGPPGVQGAQGPAGPPGPGTITSITAGAGLTGGTITTSGTIALTIPVTVASGGTGATSASAALTSLGAYPASNPSGYVNSSGAASAAPVQSVAGRTGAITLTHTDITDWTASLAPYALTTSVPVASSTTPLMDGTAAIGTGTTWARADHVHPTDTSRYAASNPSGYQTAAQVTASLALYAPLASPTFTGIVTMPTLDGATIDCGTF